jgi:hypothetical protein
MPWIKLTRNTVVNGGVHTAGEIVETNDADARFLINIEKAVHSDPPKPKPEKEQEKEPTIAELIERAKPLGIDTKGLKKAELLAAVLAAEEAAKSNESDDKEETDTE